MVGFVGGAGGSFDYVQASEPDAPLKGESWYDTDANGGDGEVKVYDGAEWNITGFTSHGDLTGITVDAHHSPVTVDTPLTEDGTQGLDLSIGDGLGDVGGSLAATLGDGLVIDANGNVAATLGNGLTIDGSGRVSIPAGAVGGSELASGAVDTTHLTADAVTTAKIAADAITNALIAADAVDTSQLATDAVNRYRIAADAVRRSHINSNAVGSTEIDLPEVDSRYYNEGQDLTGTSRVGGSGLFFDFDNDASWIELVDGGGSRDQLVTKDVYSDTEGTWAADHYSNTSNPHNVDDSQTGAATALSNHASDSDVHHSPPTSVSAGNDGVSDSTGSYTNNSGTAALVTVIFDSGGPWDANIDSGGGYIAQYYDQSSETPSVITLTALVADGQSYDINAFDSGAVRTHLRKPLNI